MNAKKILVATDYSAASEHALNYAASLARDRDAILLIVHVSQLEEYPVGELFDEEPHPSEAELAELRAANVPDPRIHCEHRLLHGDPAEQIIKLAKDENVEMIVMAAPRHSALGKLMGSVTEAVVRNADCAVCALRPPSYLPVGE